MIAEKISHYQILEKLGEGGMGEIYLAEDTVLGRRVAIKFLPAESLGNERANKRLIKEAQSAAILDHPNICSIYEVGEEEGRNFIVMQYVEGETLDCKIDAHALDLSETLEVAAQIADALAEAHARGIIHRDIKPQNIMITRRGQAKVLDFGLAKTAPLAGAVGNDAETQSLLTDPGMLVGTIAYMSPEQIRTEPLDGRSDIFSFGTMLYQMLSGRHPFASASQGAILSAILTREPPPLGNYTDGVPAELERIVRKCLEKERKQRYQSARELHNDLKALHLSVSSGLISHAEVVAPRFSRPSRFALAALVLVLLAVVGFGIYHLAPLGGQREINSIAVLPFINVDADSNLEYLSDGITDNLISSLSQLPNLKVIAHSSVFRYKGRDDLRTVARELNVQAVLTGRVINRNGQLLISVELVDPRDGTRIWGNQYNRSSADTIALQEELAHAIAEKLRPRLTGEEEKRVARKYTDNTEAYQLYLKGRYFFNKRTPEDLKKSIEFFTAALSLDSKYALAYAGLADAYTALGSSGFDAMSAKDAMRQAESAALNALAIDNNLAEAHASLAFIKMQYGWDWPAAELELNQALKLSSNDVNIHTLNSRYLTRMGRYDEALAESKRALELDPVSMGANINVSRVYYYLRRYDEMLEQCRKALEIDSTYWLAHHMTGLAYERKGMYKEAIESFQRVISITGESPTTLASLGEVYARSGREAEARAIIIKLNERAQKEIVSPLDLASIYTALNDKDEAFRLLDKAYAERSSALPAVKGDPAFDNLRSDPRYADLMRRLGLEP